jgi:hypothetical protein
MMTSVKVLLAIYFLSCAISAQELHRIAGVVVDIEGNPLPGAVITIAERKILPEIKTDDAGRFEIQDLPAGTFAVQAALQERCRSRNFEPAETIGAMRFEFEPELNRTKPGTRNPEPGSVS